MHFRVHNYPAPRRFFFQWTNWHWRGVIVRIGNKQFDIFWRPQWSAGDED